MLRSQGLLLLFITQIIGSAAYVRRQDEANERLRYSVILSEPLDSTLDWDYEGKTNVILRWSITLPNDVSGVLAFSNYDLYTDHLDVMIFGNDDQLYNGYTDENSYLAIPKDSVKLSFKVINQTDVDKGRKKRYTIRIIRPLDTCERERRNYIIDRGTIHLLTGSMEHEDFQKIKQGTPVPVDVKSLGLTLQRVQLLKSQVESPKVPDNNPHLDYLNEGVLIPNAETTYWCTRFKLPPEIMEKPHHIIRFDGVISPESEGVVHHMELFHCDVDRNTKIPVFNGICTSEQKPMGLTPCRRVIGAWALGATNFTYPEEAGGLIGAPERSPYLILEVHFNNPYLKKGIIDRSGIRIYYTPHLRGQEAAIMEVGLEYNPKNSIPPRRDAFRLSGYCTSECTKASLPPAGITVFASQLHTHLTGVEVFTRILKKNGTIVTLNIDRHYSPHFQEIRLLPKPVRIERGDMILHTCIYNTEGRINMTFGGYGISDEMCVNYMHYYPRSKLELCKTSVTDQALDGFFKIMKEYDDAKTSESQTVFENYQSIRWTPLTALTLETFYELAAIHLSCNGSDGNYSPKFDWKREYRPTEPEERDVPLDTAAKLYSYQIS